MTRQLLVSIYDQEPMGQAPDHVTTVTSSHVIGKSVPVRLDPVEGLLGEIGRDSSTLHPPSSPFNFFIPIIHILNPAVISMSCDTRSSASVSGGQSLNLNRMKED